MAIRITSLLLFLSTLWFSTNAANTSKASKAANTSKAAKAINAQDNPGVEILVQAGLNKKLLDDVRVGTLEAFVEDEFELFGQMALAVTKLDSNPMAAQLANPQKFQLLSALQEPVSYRGKYVEVQGTVRRISPINISSERLRNLIGRDFYYHVDFFVSTEKTNFHLKDEQGQVVIGGTFGITLILFDLPDVISNARRHANISVPGFYLKNWSHKTSETRGVSNELRRPNPIVFGLGSLANNVNLSAGKNMVGSTIGWLLSGLLSFLIIFGGLQLWMSLKRRRATSDNPESIDLSHLD